MPCCSNALSGLTRDCGVNLGGIKRLLIGCWIDTDNLTIENGEITAISPTPTVYEYEIRRNTSNFVSTQTYDDVSGANYFEVVLSVVFSHMTITEFIEVKSLIGNDLSVFVQDRNDEWWYIGADDYVKVTGGTAETGTAIGDANQYTLTLTGYEEHHPYHVNQTVINSILP